MVKARFTEETTVEEVLKHPKAVIILARHGIPCPTCPLVRVEMGNLKLGDVARAYGADLERLLEDLNRLLEEEERSGHACQPGVC